MSSRRSNSYAMSRGVVGPVPLSSDEEWFVERRWSGGLVCVVCGGRARRVYNRAPALFRCSTRVCGRQFGIKTGTFMMNSKQTLTQWRRLLEGLRGRLWDDLEAELSLLASLVEVVDAPTSTVLGMVDRIRCAVATEDWLPLSVEELTGGRRVPAWYVRALERNRGSG